MSSQPIVLSDANMLAEFMRQAEFKAFFEKRFAVPPDYAALLFKNGELIDAFKGGHFSVGGLVDRLKSLIGGSTHVSMLIADLKPFHVKTALKAISRDKVDIAGVLNLELQVDPDHPSNVLGLMHGVARAAVQEDTRGKKIPPRKALAKADVLDRIRVHLVDRVFEAIIGQVDANDIRGNIALQDKLQADIMQEVERVVGDLGLLVRAASVEWAQNAEEAAEQARADAERQQRDLEYQIEMAKRQAERQKDATIFSLETDLEIKKIENATEDEIQRLTMESEIRFADARENTKRRQEVEELEHQIHVLERERKFKFEDSLATARNATELQKIQKDQVQLDVEMDKIKKLHLQEMQKSEAFTELEVTERIQAQQRHHISEMQEIELRGDRIRGEMRRVDRKQELDEEQRKREHELSMLDRKKDMTPDQILAVEAGLSPDVAMVLSEQARANSSGQEQTMALMREMVDAATAAQVRTEAQALEMAKISMQGAVGVAQGAGGGSVSASVAQPSAPAPSSSMIACPECPTPQKATSKFCTACGYQLRS
ncbi:MAG: hypothetical protein AAF296_03565 [Pseudomonadota bacterium]